MARYSATLLAPLHAELKAQAEEIGTLRERTVHLQAELEQTRAQLAEALAPKAPPEPPNGAAPHGEAQRRWWQRLFSLDPAEGGA